MKKIALLITVFFTGGFSWYLASPLFIDDIVEEELPFTFSQVAPSGKSEKHMNMVQHIVDEDLDKLSPEAKQEVVAMADALMEHAIMMSDEEEQDAIEDIRKVVEQRMFFYQWSGNPELREKLLKKTLNEEEMEMFHILEEMTPEEVAVMDKEEGKHIQEMMEMIMEKMPDIPIDEPMEGEREVKVEREHAISSAAPLRPPSSSAAPPPPPTSQPELVSEGLFEGADSFHKGSGVARIFTLPNGSSLLRLENFSVTNGPALSVYLSRDPAGTIGTAYLDLGKLKGNIGNQNYSIPAETDLSAFTSVVIHCVPFNVSFASASLR